LYAGTLNREIIAVDSAAGNILWRKPLEGNVWSAPLLHEDKLYFGTDKNKVYIFDAAGGQEIKKLDSTSSVIASPVYTGGADGTDGAVVFCAEEGEIFTLTLDGENRRSWPYAIKGKLYSSPVVVNDQVIFSVFQGDQILVGYDFDGNLDAKWASVAPK